MATPVKRQGMSMMSALDGITDHPAKSLPRHVPIDSIVADENIQVRVNGLSEDNLSRILAVLENGGEINEPIILYDTPDGLILADGFHRVEAHRRLQRPTILAVVREGNLNDVLNVAEEANLKHGQPLTNEDKKSLLFRRLERDHEWAQTSYQHIAQSLGVNRTTVSRWFSEFSTRANAQVDRSRTIGADGKQRDMSASTEANKARVARPEGAQPKGVIPPNQPPTILGRHTGALANNGYVQPPDTNHQLTETTGEYEPTVSTAFERPAPPLVVSEETGIKRKLAIESLLLEFQNELAKTRDIRAVLGLDVALVEETAGTILTTAAMLIQMANQLIPGVAPEAVEQWEQYILSALDEMNRHVYENVINPKFVGDTTRFKSEE